MIASPIAGVLVFLLVLAMTDHFPYIMFGGIFAGMGASWGFDLGRRMRLPDGWEVLTNDKRAPVVYLRPFFEDARQIYDAPVGARHGGVGSGASVKRSASHEREVAAILDRVGPLVAIGKPGDRVAPHGFARMYVGDDIWQQTVLDLVKRASIVILQPEATDGTWWELQIVAGTTDWRRLLMIVPDPTLRPLGYGRIRALTSQILPVPLPENPSACDAFVFDTTGAPQAIALAKNPALALRAFVEQVQRLEAARIVSAPKVNA